MATTIEIIYNINTSAIPAATTALNQNAQAAQNAANQARNLGANVGNFNNAVNSGNTIINTHTRAVGALGAAHVATTINVASMTREFRALFDEISSGRTGNAISSFTLLLTRGIGIPITTLLGAGVIGAIPVAMSLAVNSSVSQLKKLQVELIATAGAAGLTLSQLNEIAKQSSGNGQTIGGARDTIAALLQGGKIDGGLIGGLTKATPDFATATGLTNEKGAEQLNKLFSEAGKGAKELSDRFGLLNVSQLHEIEQLDQSGQHYQAQKLLLEAVNARFKGLHDEGLSAAGKLWESLKEYASRITEGARKTVSPTPEERLAELNAKEEISIQQQSRPTLQSAPLSSAQGIQRQPSMAFPITPQDNAALAQNAAKANVSVFTDAERQERMLLQQSIGLKESTASYQAYAAEQDRVQKESVGLATSMEQVYNITEKYRAEVSSLNLGVQSMTNEFALLNAAQADGIPVDQKRIEFLRIMIPLMKDMALAAGIGAVSVTDAATKTLAALDTQRRVIDTPLANRATQRVKEETRNQYERDLESPDASTRANARSIYLQRESNGLKEIANATQEAITARNLNSVAEGKYAAALDVSLTKMHEVEAAEKARIARQTGKTTDQRGEEQANLLEGVGKGAQRTAGFLDAQKVATQNSALIVDAARSEKPGAVQEVRDRIEIEEKYRDALAETDAAIEKGDAKTRAFAETAKHNIMERIRLEKEEKAQQTNNDVETKQLSEIGRLRAETNAQIEENDALARGVSNAREMLVYKRLLGEAAGKSNAAASESVRLEALSEAHRAGQVQAATSIINETRSLHEQNLVEKVKVDTLGMEFSKRTDLINAIQRQAFIEKLGADLSEEDIKKRLAGYDEEIAAQKKVAESQRTFGAGYKSFLQTMQDGSTDAVLANDLLSTSFNDVDKALGDFITTGKFKFKDFVASMLADIAKIIERWLLMKAVIGVADLISGLGGTATEGAPIGSGLAAGFTKANGGAFLNGQLLPYAMGGVVNSPTYFPMANGQTGLMGEAGPEAVVPLQRLPNGKLGIASGSGSGGTIITLNAPISIHNPKGDGNDTAMAIRKMMEQQIKPMIQQQIVDARRPGNVNGAQIKGF